MFKKNKKQTETIKEPKEKKVRTVKVGTHKKTVIALWVVLVASVSFGVYKNFTAIDQHTTHEKEIIELRLQDTNGIENFVKNFAKSYYTYVCEIASHGDCTPRPFQKKASDSRSDPRATVGKVVLP